MPDNLTKVHIDLPNHWAAGGESLWARSLGDDLYEIDNVPFHAYGVNCGDVVRAIAADAAALPRVIALLRPGGHRTLRLMFLREQTVEEQEPFVVAILDLGGTIERATTAYLAIDVPPDADYQSLCDLLWEWEEAELLSYETCEERMAGSFDALPEDDAAN